MQRLLQRLDNGSEESLDRWLNQLYGIAELPGIIYLELLTWEDRKGRAANDWFVAWAMDGGALFFLSDRTGESGPATCGSLLQTPHWGPNPPGG